LHIAADFFVGDGTGQSVAAQEKCVPGFDLIGEVEQELGLALDVGQRSLELDRGRLGTPVRQPDAPHVENDQPGERGEALEESRKEYMQLLPDGLNTANQHLFSIKDDSGAKAGMLWFAVRNQGGKRSAFIYDVRIEPVFQRRGYATQAFQALEAIARDMGIAAISLHVFGHNTAARALYEKLGFETTNLIMNKSIAEG
jgi:ribosomal protein S18 acetylase RimI-like enzyme